MSTEEDEQTSVERQGATIATRLREWLDAQGMSIKDLENASGIPYRSLQNYLSGTREPTASALAAIALSTADLNIDWLLTGRGDKTLPPTSAIDKLLLLIPPKVLNDLIAISGTHGESFSQAERFALLHYLRHLNAMQFDDLAEALMSKELKDKLSDLISAAPRKPNIKKIPGKK